MKELIKELVKAINQGLGLFKTYLEKKKELDELARVKRNRKALNMAELVFEEAEKYMNYVSDKCALNDKQSKELKDIKNRFLKLVKKFNVLD